MSPKTLYSLIASLALWGACDNAKEQPVIEVAPQYSRPQDFSVSDHKRWPEVEALAKEFYDVCEEKVRARHAEGYEAAQRYDSRLQDLVARRNEAMQEIRCTRDMQWRCIIEASHEPTGNEPPIWMPSQQYREKPFLEIWF